jgi:hypothetical protein
VSVEVGSSQNKGSRKVGLIFKNGIVGRIAGRTRLESEKCGAQSVTKTECAAGHSSGSCSHIFTALLKLSGIQSKQSTAGAVGDGEKAWGKDRGGGGARRQGYTGVQEGANLQTGQNGAFCEWMRERRARRARG